MSALRHLATVAQDEVFEAVPARVTAYTKQLLVALESLAGDTSSGKSIAFIICFIFQ